MNDTPERDQIVVKTESDSQNAPKDNIKVIEIQGYKFGVDTDLLDDVEAFEYIDRIENKQQIAAIVPLLTFLIGDAAYQDMKAHFAKLDAEANAGVLGYKGRFRISKLNDVYMAIIEKFDPKD